MYASTWICTKVKELGVDMDRGISSFSLNE